MKKILLIAILCCSTHIYATTYVYLIHGFMGHAFNMSYLEKGLEAEGYLVVNWRYHSVRDSLPEIGRQLRDDLAQLDPVDTVNFVTHSMGGLVVRSFFQVLGKRDSLPLLNRLVMITPPNQGAEIANFASKININNWLFGENVEYMRSDIFSYVDRLPVPEMEFGIIAAARKKEFGYNIFIEGANDGYLSLSNTYLQGAKDFIVLSNMHFFIVFYQETLDNVLSFLRDGKFIHSTGSSQPSR